MSQDRKQYDGLAEIGTIEKKYSASKKSKTVRENRNQKFSKILSDFLLQLEIGLNRSDRKNEVKWHYNGSILRTISPLISRNNTVNYTEMFLHHLQT